MRGDLHAQPTQRRKTTSTLRPPPKVSLRSRSSGARSPILGHSAATGMGGGGGASHGWTVNGRLFIVIHLGQPFDSSSSSSRPGTTPGGRSFRVFFSFLGSGWSGDEKLNVSLDMPIFLSAILVVKLENILAASQQLKCK